MMNAAYTVAVLVVACILCELPMCDAGCHGPHGRRRNRTRCTDHSDCTDEDTACLGGKCQPCECRLKTQCFLNIANKARCNCTDDTLHTGDNCECLLALPALQCEPGWTLCDGSCFLFRYGPYLTWIHAENRCQAVGGNLAKIESDARYDCITNGLPLNRYWIGGRYTDSGYQWLDNTTVTYPGYWEPGYPNNLQGCMGFRWITEVGWSWTLSADNCNGFAKPICEKDAS